MSAAQESAKWREFLRPVVSGLALLIAAATAAMQHNDRSDTDARIAAIEVKTESLSEGDKASKYSIGIMSETLNNIRADVSYMRGKMEAQESMTRNTRR